MPARTSPLVRLVLALALAAATGCREDGGAVPVPDGGAAAQSRPATSAAHGTPATVPQRILLISVDTFRRDHLGCYGYPRATTPYLDALARRGAIYSDLMTVAPWTLPAHTSLLTGLTPANHRVREDSVTLPPGIRTLAEALGDAGYRTLAVVSHDYVSSLFGLDRGFDTFDDSLIKGFMENPTSDRVVDRVLELLPSSPDERFFAFVHFFDPHWTYAAPAPWPLRFTDPAYRGIVDGTFDGVPSTARSSLGEADLAELRGLYDAEIAFLDSQVGRLLRTLDERGLRDGMLIALTADHGEEFQDHGGLGHGRSVYQEMLRIPLLISGTPEFRDPRPRSRPCSLIDIAPTLAEAAGSPDATDFEGISLLEPLPPDRVRLAGTIQLGGDLHMARLGRYKWIRSEGREAGFDLQTDPREQHPLGTDPTGGRLSEALDDYLANAEHGWHLSVVAVEGPPVTCRATVRTPGRITRADRHFSHLWNTPDGKETRFDAFDLSPDGTELSFDVTAAGSRGEVVFETEPRDAPVELTVAVVCDDPAAGVWAGAGTPMPQGKTLKVQRSDPRLQGSPPPGAPVTSGCWVRVVDPPAEVTLPEATQARLRALGYLD